MLPLQEPYKLVSTELWLRIFQYLDRNELDDCEHVCTYWFKVIRFNNKFLSKRKIDYIILSTKRTFSLTLSSGNLIKIYHVDKYLDNRSIRKSTNDKSHMKVVTIRRREDGKPVRTDYPNPTLHSYYGELQQLVKENGIDFDVRWPDSHGADNYPYPTASTHLKPKYPRFREFKYKIATPPTFFFIKLNMLLKNHIFIRHWVFQNFTLTNAFITKFMLNIQPGIQVIGTRLFRLKTTKVDRMTLEFLLTVLLGHRRHLLPRIDGINDNDSFLSHSLYNSAS